ncbi:HAD family phosphatase [Alicyclobacillus cycloheptanicus]|uniref:HAD superfamily hydrolase (TIGR01484 family) n=1 Tax=Alicyclobacillus cycloheptanicus TaxID=1457 RepID=A0ABT9XL07_9BACL|nr:Cof-type HAD-IIB family hydrolase [Alicyclobacillus cycloheptanicus]MDQ0190790.1 HAD superfamily hydrolase (TIGR01484 family) [Alicyclobacillus cycloheptanicus]WDM02728.1 HAD family phosphatase [Alicyclobacillus cycloheptanicus]
MENWRLIALDMDGTLIRRDETISDENRKWIQKAREAGIEVTLATGRYIEGIVRSLASELGLSLPLVTVNGGEVWGMDGELLLRKTMPGTEVLELHQLAVEHGAHFWGRTTRQLINDQLPPDAERADWLKFGFYSEDAHVMRALWGRLQGDDRFELTNSGSMNIEINPKGVTKAAGLQLVCDRYGINPSQVITMGDSMNDISMLRWAGLGIAMGNAQDVVKAAADAVTANFDEDGVAKAIERVLTGTV